MYPEDKLTRFERARIIGARALQISMGAPVLIKRMPELHDPTEIAVAEFKNRMVPMTVVRKIPGHAPLVVDIHEADLEEMLY